MWNKTRPPRETPDDVGLTLALTFPIWVPIGCLLLAFCVNCLAVLIYLCLVCCDNTMAYIKHMIRKIILFVMCRNCRVYYETSDVMVQTVEISPSSLYSIPVCIVVSE